MPSQLVLPLSVRSSFGRENFIVAACNAQAVAFIDSWPRWPVSAAAICGPASSGKTHLASIWRQESGARLLAAEDITSSFEMTAPLIVEDVDSVPPSPSRDAQLFRLMDSAKPEAPLLLTGRELPSLWPATLPDLASRFSALLGLPLWAPGDELLMALARKLLDDRQVDVSDAVIERIVHSTERSPAAIREFIARADAKALAEARPISVALVKALMAEEDGALS